MDERAADVGPEQRPVRPGRGRRADVPQRLPQEQAAVEIQHVVARGRNVHRQAGPLRDDGLQLRPDEERDVRVRVACLHVLQEAAAAASQLEHGAPVNQRQQIHKTGVLEQNDVHGAFTSRVSSSLSAR